MASADARRPLPGAFSELQQRPRPLHHRNVDNLARQRGGTAADAFGFLVCRHDSPSVFDLRLGRRKGFIDPLDLRRVNGELALEAELLRFRAVVP